MSERLKEVADFITDLPESPRHMVDRLKRVPLWYKGLSFATILSLAACQWGRRHGYVTPPPEGTSANPAETAPESTEMPFIIDINKILPIDGNFTSPMITSEIVTMGAKIPDSIYLVQQTEIMVKQANIENPEELTFLGLSLTDSNSNTQTLVLVAKLDSNGRTMPIIVNGVEAEFLVPVASNGTAFVPLGKGEERAGTRLLPVRRWEAEINGEHHIYFTFVFPQEQGLEMGAILIDANTATGITEITDPFSGKTLTISSDQLPESIRKITAAPEALPPLPEELLAQFPEGLTVERFSEAFWAAYGNEGQPLAWYDIKAKEWVRRYETLFERSEYPAKPDWLYSIEGEGGLVDSWEGGEEEIVSLHVVFAGRVKRVFTEKVPDKGRLVEIYWMTMTYGNGDKTIDVLLFNENDETIPTEFGGAVLIVKDESNYYGSMFMPTSESYSQQEILAALRRSSFVQVEMGLFKEDFLNELKKYKDYYSIFSDNDLERAAYLQGEYPEEYLRLVEALLSSNFEAVKDGTQVGRGSLWIFTSP